MWNDGTAFDYSNDDEALEKAIAALNPDDVAGYHRFLKYAEGVYQEGYVKLGAVPFLDFASMLKAAPAMVKYQAWRSVYSMVASFVKSDKLRQALSLPHAPGRRQSDEHQRALCADPQIGARRRRVVRQGRHQRADRRHGAPCSSGSAGRSGWTSRSSEITTQGDKVTGVVTAKGELKADMVASNGDVVHSYGLIKDHARGKQAEAKLKKRTFSPSLFVVHFGLKGDVPDIPHHSILFSDRYGPLLKDIYKNGVLAEDPSLYLHHPTVTDPSMAPPGCSSFYALAPVPHRGKMDVDWAVEGPRYQEVVLDRIEKLLIPDIRDRIETIFHYTPADFTEDLGAHLGSAFSLEPVLTQSAYFRVHNRDDVLDNLYFVGAGTHPGAGIPGVVGSAKATAGLIV